MDHDRYGMVMQERRLPSAQDCCGFVSRTLWKAGQQAERSDKRGNYLVVL
jgi:hypothetical protein